MPDCCPYSRQRSVTTVPTVNTRNQSMPYHHTHHGMDPASGGSPPYECTSSYNLHMQQQQAAPQRRVNSEGELLGHHRDDGVNYTMPLTGFIRLIVTPKQISHIHNYFPFRTQINWKLFIHITRKRRVPSKLRFDSNKYCIQDDGRCPRHGHKTTVEEQSSYVQCLRSELRNIGVKNQNCEQNCLFRFHLCECQWKINKKNAWFLAGAMHVCVCVCARW